MEEQQIKVRIEELKSKGSINTGPRDNIERAIETITEVPMKLTEFDDDEYHYFVRAVPKVALDRETVHITRISGRRRTTPAKDTENTEETAAVSGSREEKES